MEIGWTVVERECVDRLVGVAEGCVADVDGVDVIPVSPYITVEDRALPVGNKTHHHLLKHHTTTYDIILLLMTSYYYL